MLAVYVYAGKVEGKYIPQGQPEVSKWVRRRLEKRREMLAQKKAKKEQKPLSPAAAAQAAEVRRLKEEEGLGNSDPRVEAAVAELLRLKALLEE